MRLAQATINSHVKAQAVPSAKELIIVSYRLWSWNKRPNTDYPLPVNSFDIHWIAESQNPEPRPSVLPLQGPDPASEDYKIIQAAFEQVKSFYEPKRVLTEEITEHLAKCDFLADAEFTTRDYVDLLLCSFAAVARQIDLWHPRQDGLKQMLIEILQHPSLRIDNVDLSWYNLPKFRRQIEELFQARGLLDTSDARLHRAGSIS